MHCTVWCIWTQVDKTWHLVLDISLCCLSLTPKHSWPITDCSWALASPNQSFPLPCIQMPFASLYVTRLCLTAWKKGSPSSSLLERSLQTNLVEIVLVEQLLGTAGNNLLTQWKEMQQGRVEDRRITECHPEPTHYRRNPTATQCYNLLIWEQHTSYIYMYRLPMQAVFPGLHLFVWMYVVGCTGMMAKHPACSTWHVLIKHGYVTEMSLV